MKKDSAAAEERARFLAGLLERALADYEAGRSGLSRLVRDLESVIDWLAEVANAGWVDELSGLWGQLEIIYALMLDGGRAALTDDERRYAAEAVAALRELLKR